MIGLIVLLVPLLYSVFDFFKDNFPPFRLIIQLFPVALLWSFLVLSVAGLCKEKWKWKTGYTRKFFHFFIFFTAFYFQRQFGLPGVFILGWAVTLLLGYTSLKGDGNLLYEALAREKDVPYRTKYILYSYLATFFGGVISNVFFGPFAVFGYAITGIADAIAEPVGTRFGKHQYRVFSFDKKKISYRSLEGSSSVFVATFLVCFFVIQLFPPSYTLTYGSMFMIASFCTLAEAISPSGFDNLLLQVVGSFLVKMLVVVG